MADTKVQSLARGRIGAGVLAIVSAVCITLGMSPDEQQAASQLMNQILQWVGGGSGLASAIMAFISKFREKK